MSTNSEIDAINKFIHYNVVAMQSWVTLYAEKRMKWDSEKKSFGWLNGKTMPYLDHLKENMPNIYPNGSMVDQITKKYG